MGDYVYAEFGVTPQIVLLPITHLIRQLFETKNRAAL